MAIQTELLEEVTGDLVLTQTLVDGWFHVETYDPLSLDVDGTIKVAGRLCSGDCRRHILRAEKDVLHIL